jgi:hypothetical protein
MTQSYFKGKRRIPFGNRQKQKDYGARRGKRRIPKGNTTEHNEIKEDGQKKRTVEELSPLYSIQIFLQI